MHIVVASIFRNAARNGQVDKWLDRVQTFKNYMEGQAQTTNNFVSALAIEGDSTDNTWAALTHGAVRRAIPLVMRTCNHGGPVFGSTEDPARMAALSEVGDCLLSTASLDHTIDYLIYVESDLIWMPETFSRLIESSRSYTWGNAIGCVISPMVYSGKYPLSDGSGEGDVFYDIWGFRGLPDESRFGSFPAPYHPSLARSATFGGVDFAPIEVASVGSCLCIPGIVLRDPNCQTMDDYALVGWSRRVRAAGYRILVEPHLSVRHP